MGKNQKLNRRDFIKLSSIASASLPIALSGFPIYANEKPKAFQFSSDNNNVLVLIQLQGGNDGLNTIFDLNQYDNLQNVRSNIIIPDTDLLTVDSTTRFHPAMSGIQEIWNQEKLGIIQNVGYPNQNRSHFRSTDIWHSASDANEYISSGWIGRFFDINHNAFPEGYPNENNPHPFAITVGKVVSETCQGTSTNFSMALEDPDNPGTALVSNTGKIPNNCYSNALSFVNDTIKQTNAYAEGIKNASNSGNNVSDKYTSSDLSEKLKHVAKLISGGLQTKVYVVQIGGFDNHDNQVVEGETTTGKHAVLLQELSDAMLAFQDDLKLLNIDNRVLGMTYSEFGRRIRSNAGLGTDHGTAAPLFVFGNCAKNQVLGDAPEINTQVDDQEGIQMQYDFRNVYSTILTDWLGATKSESNAVLFDSFDALPLFKSGCSAALSTDNVLLSTSEVKVYPNPTADFINIKFFGNNENLRITLYNSIGAIVKQIANKKYSSIQHTIKINISSLPKGNYFIHYQSKNVSKTKKILKY
ncbi:T9SS type A sorting domain-containing protein [Polaribacter porphyrae]|uniref:Secretion system C-terminal sorting domain-containing protein n=1 Tax=Polaribacter porphyrae TaxID=1137780 RepID=A0A2S7WQ97_9FLAO|nr:T9SS type A sorting domain-containing protein [Polaribacter porphyrae]PQJ79616.1 hypothetical protein BTO18_10725 [Polaribacter porphyrae]